MAVYQNFCQAKKHWVKYMAKTIALLMFGSKKQMFYLFNSLRAAIKRQQEPSEVKKSIPRQLILYNKQRGRKKNWTNWD